MNKTTKSLHEEVVLEMGPGKTLVANGEYMLRMSFLLQAAEMVEDISLKRFYVMEAKNISKR